jgi:hypothetical protein
MSGSLLSDIEVTEQCGDASLQIVADVADAVDGLVVGVGYIPIEVALARIDRTGIAAAHGHNDIGGVHNVVGERLDTPRSV